MSKIVVIDSIEEDDWIRSLPVHRSELEIHKRLAEKNRHKEFLSGFFDTKIRLKGGKGSGFYGHAGRLGKRGGSRPNRQYRQFVSQHFVEHRDKVTFLPGADARDLYRRAYVMFPDGTFSYDNGEPNYHTPIYAAHILLHPEKYTRDWIDLAKQVIEYGEVEDVDIEKIVMRTEGAISVSEEEFSNGTRALILKGAAEKMPSFDPTGLSVGDGNNFAERVAMYSHSVRQAKRNVLLQMLRMAKRLVREDYPFNDLPSDGKLYQTWFDIDNTSIKIEDVLSVAGISQDLEPVLKEVRLKGGEGSGFYGHVGRPGKRGGSAPKSGVGFGKTVTENNESAPPESKYSGEISRLLYVPDGTRNKRSIQRVQDAIAMIEQVHGDGGLKALPVVIKNFGGDSSASYVRSARTLEGIEFRVGSSECFLPIDFCHEFGHHIGFSKIYKSVPQDLQQELAQAIKDSGAVQYIRSCVGKEPNGSVPGLRSPFMSFKDYMYLADPNEIFARAYAQYIATRSRNKVALQQIANNVEYHTEKIGETLVTHYPSQWTPEKFKPIGRVFDKIFKNLGWRR